MGSVAQAVARRMVPRKYGRIINVVSLSGLKGLAGQTNYSAAKGGVIAATKALAQEVGRKGITVNAVAPGFVDSPWNREWPQDRKAASVEKTPLKRACTPEDIAEVAFFLLAGGSMITGQTVIVDGGLTL